MKNMSKAFVLAAGFLAHNAQAEVNFNGFASIVGGVTTSSDEALYGYDDNFDFSKDSLLALQASSDLGEGLTITAQVLSRGENDWNTEFEWAYIAYEPTDNLRLLAGKQRAPFYMFSDFLDVSYAYPWITPPEDLYAVPFDTFDGLSVIYTSDMAGFDTTLHVIYGGNNSDMIFAGRSVNADINDLFGLTFTVTRDWLTLRAAYFDTEINAKSAELEGLGQLWVDAGYTDINNELLISEDKGTFLELGFQIDYNNLLIVGEFTQLETDTVLADDDAYYIMAGYRFDNMLVHVTYGAKDGSTDRLTDDVPAGALDGLISMTNGATDAESSDIKYVTLGLRWDFHDSAALKFEYTNYTDDLNGDQDAGLFRTALVTVF